MGVFPDDHEISNSTLVKLWVAEGFIKPSKARTLEEVVEGCLKDLVNRNLILVRKWGLNGRIKTCGIHNLLRELCLKVASKEKFLYVVKCHDIPESLNEVRRLVIHGNIPALLQSAESATFIRSLYCKGGNLRFDFRLLKVLEVEGVASEFDGSFLEIKLQQVNLRYFHCDFLPSPLCLGASRPAYFVSLLSFFNIPPMEFANNSSYITPWSYSCTFGNLEAQLRHVQVVGIHLPDPPQSDEENGFVALQNLQMLFEVKIVSQSIA